ncbi:hypothetical protein ACMU_08825 [Actibacterium mucosum KCTC 23349]|uniref:HTH gntR-type domain-containing protein n=1 Tax=Actibacterium mucosum KCTC 23349 TaxID=1454373 RepID=A0A037ZHF3_9RHOB|nr:GntR family transcriptional regulator [Actibacterium mucosum]KAJ55865.1 hypothetical protein ACMU_08825 [Actibacterium mucosum KCTC 23349]
MQNSKTRTGETVVGPQTDFSALGTIDRSRPLGPQVYEIVRLGIIQDRLRPNDPINETELSAQLGVSRTPVREAYQQLIEDGLIESRSKAGTLVAPLDEARAREGTVIRRALEREVVAILAADPPDLRPLDSIIALQSVAVSHDDHLEFFTQDERFHAALADLAGLPTAWRLVHSVKGHTDRVRFMLSRDRHKRNNVAFNAHLALLDAIRDGDVELAKALITKHVNAALVAVPAPQ